MSKRMLILQACGSEDEINECKNIASQAKLYEIEVKNFCIKDFSELKKCLSESKGFDYIYLSSHGNTDGFGNESGKLDVSWYTFGSLLCSYENMNEECIVLLSCCRGGLNQVAYNLFYICESISYIVGPRQSLSSHDMLISFNILLYNIEQRRIDPVIACEKIRKGADIRFICFDRLETEIEVGYNYWIDNFLSHSDENNLDEVSAEEDE